MAVLGAYFVQTGRFSVSALMASIPVGFLVASILFIHHFPQSEADRKYGKMTPVVRLGRKRSVKVYTGLIFLPFAWLAVSIVLEMLSPFVLIATALIPIAWKASRNAVKNAENPEIRKAKMTTVVLHFFMGVLISAGLVLGGTFPP
jgi:1,4-dihydroxy-2-naphthoate octaprenyltransferase